LLTESSDKIKSSIVFYEVNAWGGIGNIMNFIEQSIIQFLFVNGIIEIADSISKKKSRNEGKAYGVARASLPHPPSPPS
jgi:esterase/lipase superfamily enzyme